LIRKIQFHHVPNLKRDSWVQFSRLLYHRRGKVDAPNFYPGVPQICGNVPGTASQVADLTSAQNLGRETVEKFPIERLALQFVCEVT